LFGLTGYILCTSWAHYVVYTLQEGFSLDKEIVRD